MKTKTKTKMILLACLVAAGAAGCDSVYPSVTVKTSAPERLVATDDAADDLVITVEYADGDGDLGGGVAEVYDCRAEGLRTDLPLPQIAPAAVVDEGRAITGELELHVNDVGAVAAVTLPTTCRDLGVTEVSAGAAVFCVVPVDAAGHSGDGDCTQEIALAE